MPGLEIALRSTARGKQLHAPSADHHLSLLTGPPVRISCLPSGQRCIRQLGEINFFPAGMADAWFEDDASEQLELRLPAALVELAASEMGLDAQRAAIAPLCHVTDAQVEHIARALAAEHDEGSPNGLLFRESLGLALALRLLARHRAPAPSRARLSQAQLSRIADYIEANLASDVSLLRLARVAGVSASHFRVLFKRSLGVSVHEHVIRRRVERARALLAGSALPASQVALEAGFSHQSHMARCMRRVLGIAPAAVARPASRSATAVHRPRAG